MIESAHPIRPQSTAKPNEQRAAARSSVRWSDECEGKDDVNGNDDDDMEEHIATEDPYQVDAPVPPPPIAHPAPRPVERVKALPKPTAPTIAQRERHELTHLPFMDWCRHCVMARSQAAPHRRSKKHSTNREVPVVSADFCFMGQAEQEGTHPIVVVRDHNTRVTLALNAPRKVDHQGGVQLVRGQCHFERP